MKMKSEVLNPELNYVVFTKRAKPVSDFDVESAYEKYKDLKYIEISSNLLLYRFRVGVNRGEIKPFNLIVEDFDGQIYEDICEDGKLNGKAFNSKILCRFDNYLDALIGFGD